MFDEGMAKDTASTQQHRQQQHQNQRWSIDVAIPSPPPTSSSKPASPSPSFSGLMNNNARHQRLASDDNTSFANPPGIQRSRKVACDVCRERKVRCDRNQPSCGRCSRLGSRCKYSPPERQESSRIDVSQVLETLHARLAQAEAQLAMANQPLNLHRTLVSATGTEQFSRLDFGSFQTQRDIGGVANQGHVFSAGSEDGNGTFGDINLDDPMVVQAMDEWDGFGVDIDIDLNTGVPKESSTISSLEHQNILCVPQTPGMDLTEPCQPQVMLSLFYHYFDILHPLIPILDRERFMLMVEKSSAQPTLQFKSLMYAVAMLGASVSEKQTYLEEELYSYSRTYLEMTETQYEGANFLTLEALQACVLTIWYEFKGTGFARPWMSLGRAIRLGKMMGLHRIDRNDAVKENLSFQLPLAETEDPVELEERRRTFWALFIFDAYAGVRTGSAMSICEAEVSTTLPAPSFPSPGNPLIPMPSLKNAKTLPETKCISPFAGIVLMVSLYYQCLQHLEATKEQDRTGDMSYPFWMKHYSMDKTLNECSAGLFKHINTEMRQNEPLALSLRLNMCAVSISLHDIAIAKAQKENLPASLIMESENRRLTAAMEMVEDLKLLPNMDAKKFKMWQHTATFLMWPLSKAAQVLLHQIKTLHGDLDTAVTSLQLVRNVMGDFRDSSGHWKNVLNEVTMLLAEMRNGPKKRKRGSKHDAQAKDGAEEQ